MITVEADCYNCNSSESSPYAVENGFSLVKCAGCGLLYVTPRPSDDELAKSHECGVHQGDAELDMTGRFRDQLIPSYIEKLHDLYGDELAERKRAWLDIGCGHGELLMALTQVSGGQVEPRGLEPNRKKQESAAARGLDITYFDLSDHHERYDVISLLNVYSHLPDPPGFLRLCKQLLKPGGELVLETGDTADLPAERHHRPLLLPDHLSFASERIVSDILRRSGFEIISVHKYRSFPFKRSASRWLKEVIKCVWPGKQSRIGEFIERTRRGRDYDRDMFIRARLPDA
ncbi:MAG: methyltransferase domain-containing protein [Planctomycetota bacterium]|jgi:SAM-dependent methyltransferase